MTKQTADRLVRMIEDIAGNLRAGAELARDGCDDEEFERLRARLEEVAGQIVSEIEEVTSMVDDVMSPSVRLAGKD